MAETLPSRPLLSGPRGREKYLGCCLRISGKKSQEERPQRIWSICDKLSLTLNPQGTEYLWHDLTDLSIDFLLSFNVEKCNMITQEWDKFRKRQEKKLLDATALDSWVWFTFLQSPTKIFMKHRKRCKNHQATIHQGLYSIVCQSQNCPSLPVGGQI